MIFLDVETQNDWTGGESFSIADLKVSYVGVIDEEGKEYDFWEDDMPKLAEMIKAADWTVGYNSISFDLPVIANYVGQEINDVPQIDLMVAAQKAIGYKPKLDALTTATFGEGKIGSGGDAVRYYAAGELDKLKKYCLMDVEITKKLYEFGLEKGYIKYYDKKGFIQEAKIDWEDGKRVVEKAPNTISMFG